MTNLVITHLGAPVRCITPLSFRAVNGTFAKFQSAWRRKLGLLRAPSNSAKSRWHIRFLLLSLSSIMSHIGKLNLIIFSFGKRAGGAARRQNECLVLEPSEMIVVSFFRLFLANVDTNQNINISPHWSYLFKQQAWWILHKRRYCFEIFVDILDIKYVCCLNRSLASDRFLRQKMLARN